MLIAACAPATLVEETPREAPTQDTIVAEVEALAVAIANDLRARGPLAWLDHFEDGPDFFMASDGAIAFPDYAAARDFLLEFAPTVARMELRWSSVKASVLGDGLATLGASYRETLLDTHGTERRFEGYFTATAVRAGASWKLRNLHWSSPRPAETMQ